MYAKPTLHAIPTTIANACCNGSNANCSPPPDPNPPEPAPQPECYGRGIEAVYVFLFGC